MSEKTNLRPEKADSAAAPLSRHQEQARALFLGDFNCAQAVFAGVFSALVHGAAVCAAMTRLQTFCACLQSIGFITIPPSVHFMKAVFRACADGSNCFKKMPETPSNLVEKIL